MKVVKSSLSFGDFQLPTFEKKLKENYWISIHGSSGSPNIIMEGCIMFFCFHMYLVEKYLAETSND
jgi:hypothetical protein